MNYIMQGAVLLPHLRPERMILDVQHPLDPPGRLPQPVYM
jgi:hypothetical protein